MECTIHLGEFANDRRKKTKLAFDLGIGFRKYCAGSPNPE